MKHAIRRFLAPLTPGVKLLLLVLTVMYVLSVAGSLLRVWDPFAWLGLTGPAFWGGKVWTVVTYALVPGSILDFIFNWILILMLGSYLERVWSRGQLWMSCLISTLAVGLVFAAAQASSPRLLVGTTPVVFGLLAAWGWLFGHERVLFFFIWEMSVRHAAIAMTAVSWIAMAFCPCIGPLNATIMLCGGAAGLAHIWAQQKLLRSRHSQTVPSERMGRLEL